MVLGIKEDLVECAIVCIKSVAILSIAILTLITTSMLAFPVLAYSNEMLQRFGDFYRMLLLVYKVAKPLQHCMAPFRGQRE